jgi:ribose-phosphate pyrophosphokinase
MKILNLVDLDKSNIKYQISKFPDSQQQVKILSNVHKQEEIPGSKVFTNFGSRCLTRTIIEIIQIKSRLNNFQDLEKIICATKSLRELGVKEIHLYTPYFLGSRSDRKFEEGSNNYLKDVICPIINSLRFESVTVLDPHSDVLEACLNNFKKVDNLSLVRFATNNYQYENQKKSGKPHEDFILISPDAGANKKIFKVAEQIGYKGDIITCSKSRDKQGKLSHTVVPITNIDNFKKDIIIIDDICDGGATFINIAKEIKKDCKSTKIYLIITHGIFSKGTTELSHYFDGIYTTNSYRDINALEGLLVKQLNVF